MPKLRVISKLPPEPTGDSEKDVAAIQDYILQMSEELAYVLTHLEADNINDSTFERIQGMIPRPYTGLPVMDGEASAGQSEGWSRGDHRHPKDTSKADVTALEETVGDLADHVADIGNPHEVTAAQVGLGNVDNVRQYSASNPPPIPTPAQVGAIPATEKGSAGGVAELDSNGMVPSAQLPSYVDDVLEYANLSAFPVTGESGKIYVALDTGRTYRWSGSAYVEISESLALGETSSTAYRGDRGKTAYDHSQLTSGNPHNVSASDVGLGNVDNVQQYSALNPPPLPTPADIGAATAQDLTGHVGDTNNPHSVTAAQVGVVPNPADPATDTLTKMQVGSTVYEITGGGGGGPEPATATPLMDGTGAVGSSLKYAREDHEHPADTNKQSKITASGILKGDGQGGVSAATAGTDYQAPLTIDATPTANSTNPVQSGGVYDALGTKLNKAAVSLSSSNDLDDIVEPGWYKCTTAPANVPSGNFLNAWFEVVVNGSNILQFAYSNPSTSTGPTPKVRVRINGAWGEWGSFDKNYPYANQSQLAYVETGTTASRAYAVGEYFCWNGLLYQAKTAISSGGTITPGTNCERATGGGLNQIAPKLLMSEWVTGTGDYSIASLRLYNLFIVRVIGNDVNFRTLVVSPGVSTQINVDATASIYVRMTMLIDYINLKVSVTNISSAAWAGGTLQVWGVALPV